MVTKNATRNSALMLVAIEIREERHLVIFKDKPIKNNINEKASSRSLAVAIRRGIFKNNQITHSLCFVFIPS